MDDIILCKQCVEEYGHDTDKPMACPNCGKYVGCFWHPGKYKQHVAMCKSVNRKEEEE